MPGPAFIPMARRSLRNLFSRPATRRYPDQVRDPFPGARGALEVDAGPCNFCERCARHCPTEALQASRAQRWLTFDELRCISCGVCVELCTKQALRLTDRPAPVLAVADTGPRVVAHGHHEWRGTVPPDRPRTRVPRAG